VISKLRGWLKWQIGLGLVCLPLLMQAPSAEKDWLFVGVQLDKVAVIDCSRDVVETEIRLRHKVPMDMIASPDKSRLFVVTNQKESIEVIDIAERRVSDSIDLSQGGRQVKVFGLVAHPDGKTLYLHVKTAIKALDEYAVEPPQIVALDVSKKQVRKLTEVPEGISRLALSKDGEQLFGLGREVLTMDVASGKIVERMPLYTKLPDGSTLTDIFHIYGFEDQSGVYSVPYYAEAGYQAYFGLLTVDTVSKRIGLTRIGDLIPLFSTIIAPDRRYAYGVLHELVKIDLEQKRVVKTVSHDRIHYALNIGSNGQKLYLAGAGPEVDVFDAASLQLITSIPLSGDVADASMRLIVVP